MESGKSRNIERIGIDTSVLSAEARSVFSQNDMATPQDLTATVLRLQSRGRGADAAERAFAEATLRYFGHLPSSLLHVKCENESSLVS